MTLDGQKKGTIMKRTVITLVLLASVLFSGCSTVREQAAAAGGAPRTDVFREVSAGSPIPPGYADLRVVSSLKTHRPGAYPLRPDAHGSPEYALLLTIDGQTVRLKGTVAAEDCEPRRLRDPEAGNGIRYAFRMAVRLRAGTHRVVVASPEDDVTVAGAITLAAGRSCLLELEPVYGTSTVSRRPAFYGSTDFLQGVRGFRMVVQGEEL
jgi:hypothetical protein